MGVKGHKKTKLILLALSLFFAILITATIVFQFSISSSGYTLVGEDYFVNVSKKQYEQFGKGIYSDMDLDQYVIQFNLEKIYFNDAKTGKEAGYKVSNS